MSALDVVEVQTEAGLPATADSSEPEGTYRKRKLGVFFWLSVIWLSVLILSAIFADLLPLKDPNETFRGVARSGPGAEHWFGADNIGHDVFARTIYGARRSLAVATTATALGLSIGAAVGLVAGFYRRAMDGAIMALLNILLAIPGLVLLLALISFLAPPGTASPSSQTFWATIALSILTVPTIARVTRAQTMVWGDRDFVMASRTLGARNKRIMVREIFPNVVPTLLSFASPCSPR
jgi:peptide/nickel transport system permease protein